MHALTKYFPVFLVFGSGLILSTYSCQHDMTMSEGGVTPVDTTGNGGGGNGGTDNPTDTTVNQGDPCDPDVVYFELDVLPILRSNCAFSGCHDAASAQDGVNLTTYASVVNSADVEPYDLDGSDLYEVITDNDPDDRMPPVPNSRLTADQINIISRWIMQGATNETCDPDAGGCDTEQVSYAAQIAPVLNTNCLGCHNNSAPSAGISVEGHDNVAALAQSGLLLGVVSWSAGYTPMPYGAASPLPECTVSQIQSWIEAGAPNN